MILHSPARLRVFEGSEDQSDQRIEAFLEAGDGDGGVPPVVGGRIVQGGDERRRRGRRRAWADQSKLLAEPRCGPRRRDRRATRREPRAPARDRAGACPRPASRSRESRARPPMPSARPAGCRAAIRSGARAATPASTGPETIRPRAWAASPRTSASVSFNPAIRAGSATSGAAGPKCPRSRAAESRSARSRDRSARRAVAYRDVVQVAVFPDAAPPRSPRPGRLRGSSAPACPPCVAGCFLASEIAGPAGPRHAPRLSPPHAPASVRSRPDGSPQRARRAAVAGLAWVSPGFRTGFPGPGARPQRGRG